jgi:hypothetical protein
VRNGSEKTAVAVRDAAGQQSPHGLIEHRTCVIRGQKVMLDVDLAFLYGVETRTLNQAVSRNIDRFPEDFRFKLTRNEIMRISQFVISSDIRFSNTVHAYTEQGVAMLSGVLRSRRAVQVNVAIMRAFVKLRRMLSTHKALARKLQEIEAKTERHDTEIRAIFDAIRELMSPTVPEPARRMGFHKA